MTLLGWAAALWAQFAAAAWPYAVAAAAITWCLIIARAGQQASDKAYAVEQRLNAMQDQGYYLFPAQSAWPAYNPGGGVLFANGQGTLGLFNAQGLGPLRLDGSMINTSQYTVGNTTSYSPLSTPFTVPAGDAAQSTEYEMEIRGSGQIGTNFYNGLSFTLLIGGAQNGTFTIGGTFFSGTNGFALGATFAFRITYTVTVEAGNTCHVNCQGTLSDSAANRLATNTIAFNADVDANTFNTAVANTLQIEAAWAATAGGQTLTAFVTKFTRRGT